MATTLEKLMKANRWRVRTGKYGSDERAGWNGHFLVPLEGEIWQVIISDGEGWEHLSISNAQRRMLPSWTVMRRVKEVFFGDEVWACQFFPAKNDYINDHQWCLHIWAPLEEKLPTPSYVLV